MKKIYIDPIFEATHKILREMIGTEAEKGELTTRENGFVGQDVNISIGVTGNLSGFIYLSMEKDTALSVASKMCGMEVDKLDDFVNSALGELANIITGNSATKLSNIGYQCDITPPSVVVGKDIHFSTEQKEVLALPLETGIGEFEINLSLQED
ncbi:chemotaxis protein CheX [Natroniella sulfidigena]|uniref:chemotaxis protein CheX n=1 Tax=Natroniella sulfidigena TaxID=723921 RepID=UPI00200AB501|nr:chemotaxis protein CheX [Natroniella sulfidigena]MCK8816594.1 chemotaxis protein CheX [Natroniella sulfidigena]